MRSWCKVFLPPPRRCGIELELARKGEIFCLASQKNSWDGRWQGASVPGVGQVQQHTCLVEQIGVRSHTFFPQMIDDDSDYGQPF